MEKRGKEASFEYSRRRKEGELEGISRAEYIAEMSPELAAYVNRKNEGKKELYAKVMDDVNMTKIIAEVPTVDLFKDGLILLSELLENVDSIAVSSQVSTNIVPVVLIGICV